ncbi:Hap5p NDAI_0A08730 [Naumovozyma dairenensis CBS 421]|uniref:Core Histone H2A/H2B/H3 domain-containing protein n=1 Tax=Naumovozyma dairenensis (strain ATCC 10597 / BCRC 20456 / CBS 421 / NBRC 0211 / NRRL Y-12639) TaxID=1071378 RepID=G0W5D8_NAUDC|nr:hypothetical protein NDAI_0A08730 [Naumovozyma dairenensis CBS 421]CCD23026.1 hypothetical protein NDAI_0A08730 [Naumovozyma dairenensis CBS 421]
MNKGNSSTEEFNAEDIRNLAILQQESRNLSSKNTDGDTNNNEIYDTPYEQQKHQQDDVTQLDLQQHELLGVGEDGEDDDDEYDVFRNVGLGLTGHYKEIMIQYWQELINEIEATNEPGSKFQDDFKSSSLPFARIRKVMKTDEEVRMISAEVPIIFAKACEVFITELTMRAWCVAENNRRRTLQKADIAEALKKCDMFDFLIDIVPRGEEQQ